jgi:hypothetical protein
MPRGVQIENRWKYNFVKMEEVLRLGDPHQNAEFASQLLVESSSLDNNSDSISCCLKWRRKWQWFVSVLVERDVLGAFNSRDHRTELGSYELFGSILQSYRSKGFPDRQMLRRNVPTYKHHFVHQEEPNTRLISAQQNKETWKRKVISSTVEFYLPKRHHKVGLVQILQGGHVYMFINNPPLHLLPPTAHPRSLLECTQYLFQHLSCFFLFLCVLSPASAGCTAHQKEQYDPDGIGRRSSSGVCEHYTPESLLKRESLRWDTRVRDVLRSIWRAGEVRRLFPAGLSEAPSPLQLDACAYLLV